MYITDDKKIRRNKTFLNKIYMHTTCHARTHRNVIFFNFPMYVTLLSESLIGQYFTAKLHVMQC